MLHNERGLLFQTIVITMGRTVSDRPPAVDSIFYDYVIDSGNLSRCSVAVLMTSTLIFKLKIPFIWQKRLNQDHKNGFTLPLKSQETGKQGKKILRRSNSVRLKC